MLHVLSRAGESPSWDAYMHAVYGEPPTYPVDLRAFTWLFWPAPVASLHLSCGVRELSCRHEPSCGLLPGTAQRAGHPFVPLPSTRIGYYVASAKTAKPTRRADGEEWVEVIRHQQR